MRKFVLVVFIAAFFAGCTSAPSESPENTVGGASVSSVAEAPMAKATGSLTFDLGSKGQSGRFAIADVITYGGAKPTITAPAGWTLIRDDVTPSTRQSLYAHVVAANDSNTPGWTFSAPVDAQGVVLLLDNAAAAPAVEASSGQTGSLGEATANSVETASDGDLIIGFFATDFGGTGLGPEMPTNMGSIVNHQSTSHEYWILGTYQSRKGETGDAVCKTAQLFNWAAAQVAIKKASAAAK